MIYDFGFGNETGYYDVTRVYNGVPCNRVEGSDRVPWGEAEEEEAMRDPASVCYTGTYPADAFVGRAMEVSICFLLSVCSFVCLFGRLFVCLFVCLFFFVSLFVCAHLFVWFGCLFFCMIWCINSIFVCFVFLFFPCIRPFL